MRRTGFACIMIFALASVLLLTSDQTQAASRKRPHYGSTLQVCAGQLPSGWAVINVLTNFTICGGNPNNIWVIFDLNGARTGASVTVCTFSANNAGWVIINYLTNFTVCYSSINNLAVIQKT